MDFDGYMVVNFKGATFNRGFNRALGTLVAGILAIVVAETALSCGHVAEPIIIGLSIFMIGIIIITCSLILSYTNINIRRTYVG